MSSLWRLITNNNKNKLIIKTMKNTFKNTELPQCAKTAVMQSVMFNEFRVGNWVEIIQPKKGCYTAIQPSYFTVNIEKNYKKIPLTEFKLERLGLKFVIRNMYEIKVNDEIKLQFYENQQSFIQMFCNGTHIELRNIKHVNELQNLYFSLTGRELTVA